MLEQGLYTEINEFLQESIALNEGTLTVVNEDMLSESDKTEVYVGDVRFRCGYNIERKYNLK